MKYMTIAITLLCISFPAAAMEYVVDYDKSHIQFSGKHAGNDFTGTFEKWEAGISFSPHHLEDSSIHVTIDTKSAKTGNSLYDGTLPSKDWFDVENHLNATFISHAITRTDDGHYKLQGTLTLKNIAKDVEFVFVLSADDNNTIAKADFTLDRLDFAIGKQSDPQAEWVDRSITITLHIVAKPKKAGNKE